MTRRVLITGASIAGLSAAFWLSRTGWEVEVVERADAFRSGGQNVDIRGIAHQVVDRMGLTDAVRRRNTTEEGTAYIGGRGEVLGEIPADREQDGPTAELEILRGDLAEVVRDALPDEVSVRYGDHIAAVETRGDGARVTFASGGEEDYDLVVIAEGVRSATRRMVFGSEVQRRVLGLNLAYGTIPRTPADDRWWRWYTAPRRRGITLRPDNVGTIRATLAYVDREVDLSEWETDAARAELTRVFADAGWEASRVTAAFATSEDMYIDYLTQIRVARWSRGRVVLTGDAAWCVTPLGGGGTSLALTGSYVLAAYLSDAADPATGLRRYEEWMRPFIDDVQKLPPGTPDLFYPQSSTGVGILRFVQRLLTTKPLRSVAARAAHVAQTDQELPELRV